MAMMRCTMIRVTLLVCLVLFGSIGCDAQINAVDGQAIDTLKLDQFLNRQLNLTGIPSLSMAVINNGKIVYHRAIGVTDLVTRRPVNNESVFEAASLSKTAFTYFVLRLVDKGILSLDTPLYHYMVYPDIARDERYKLITARMVLSHTTGFPNWRRDLADTSMHVNTGDLYLKFSPGTRFSYSGEGYYYLAQVIAHLTQHTLQSLDRLFQQEVSIPLGLKHAWFSTNTLITQHKVTGYLNGKAVKQWPGSIANQDSTWFGAAGGLHTEAVSYAQLLIAIMNGKGLTKKSSAELFRSQVVLPKDEDHDGDTDWGLGIAISPGKNNLHYNHKGNNGNFQSYFVLNRNTKNGYVVFLSSNQADVFFPQLEKFFLTGQ